MHENEIRKLANIKGKVELWVVCRPRKWCPKKKIIKENSKALETMKREDQSDVCDKKNFILTNNHPYKMNTDVH